MAFNMVTLLTEQDSEFPSLHEAASTLFKMPHCWKSHVTAHFLLVFSCGALPGPGDYGTGCETELNRLKVLNILLTCIDQLSHIKSRYMLFVLVRYFMSQSQAMVMSRWSVHQTILSL